MSQSHDSVVVPSVDYDYASCSTTELIERISVLERQLREQTARVAALSGGGGGGGGVGRADGANTETPSTATAAPAIETCSTRAHTDTDQAARESTSIGIGAYARQRSRSRSRSRSHSASRRARPFDPTQYSTRHIALKFAYLGGRYNGFEHANGNVLPMPTIEEVLWKALRKTRLISPPVAEGADDSMDVLWEKKRRLETYTDGKSGGRDEARGKVRLDLNWEACQYSKCGRTDRGVSAFGQVIGIRVRSNRPRPVEEKDDGQTNEARDENQNGNRETSPSPSLSQPTSTTEFDFDDALPSIDVDELDSEPYSKPFDPINDEIAYVHILNSILPPDIRILAWCPQPPANFDARFSCRERRYKYFFTNPAFAPTPGPKGMTDADGKPSKLREGWLNIDKMREAAKKLEGLHDFRNLCKIDASKQMPSCERRITFADVVEVEDPGQIFALHPGLNASASGSEANASELVVSNGPTPSTPTGPKVYAFCVNGSAFLWHQVRCMVAALFLVGQGLEQPSLIDELLDVEKNPGRPMYEMADDAPLVLWDCIFPDQGDKDKDSTNDLMTDSLNWIYAGDQATLSTLGSKGDGKYGNGGVVDELWTQWREAKIQEVLAGSLLDLAIGQGDGVALQQPPQREVEDRSRRRQKVFDGGNNGRLAGRYVPVMKKPRMDSLHVQNAKWLSVRKARSEAAEAEARSMGQVSEATANTAATDVSVQRD